LGDSAPGGDLVSPAVRGKVRGWTKKKERKKPPEGRRPRRRWAAAQRRLTARSPPPSLAVARPRPPRTTPRPAKPASVPSPGRTLPRPGGVASLPRARHGREFEGTSGSPCPARPFGRAWESANAGLAHRKCVAERHAQGTLRWLWGCCGPGPGRAGRAGRIETQNRFTAASGLNQAGRHCLRKRAEPGPPPIFKPQPRAQWRRSGRPPRAVSSTATGEKDSLWGQPYDQGFQTNPTPRRGGWLESRLPRLRWRTWANRPHRGPPPKNPPVVRARAAGFYHLPV